MSDVSLELGEIVQAEIRDASGVVTSGMNLPRLGAAAHNVT
jgi:hypothetical protein